MYLFFTSNLVLMLVVTDMDGLVHLSPLPLLVLVALGLLVQHIRVQLRIFLHNSIYMDFQSLHFYPALTNTFHNMLLQNTYKVTWTMNLIIATSMK